MTIPALSPARVEELRNWCRPIAPHDMRKERQPAQCWENLTAVCDEYLALLHKLAEARVALEAGANALHYENRMAILDDKMRLRNMDSAATLRSLAHLAGNAEDKS